MQPINTHEFIHALYAEGGDATEGLFLHVWTLPNALTKWFPANPPGVVSAAAYVDALDDDRDVYVGVGLGPADLGEKARVGNDDDPKRGVTGAAGLVALVADLDFAGDHKKQCPPDEATCRRILDEVGLPPTALIHSGHGLQVWWAFKEPLTFDTAKERAVAYRLSEAWGRTIQGVAHRAGGYRLDSVYDLGRIFRVPGTTNNKSTPVPVTVLEFDDSRRYVEDDFEAHLLDYVLPPDKAADFPMIAAARGDWPEVNLRAEFPLIPHEALVENDQVYADLWNHKRKDLDAEDLSAWDMALAHYLTRVSWPVDAVAAILVRHRQKWGDTSDKVYRVDYYQRTIAKARLSQQVDMTRENAAEVVADEDASHEDRVAAIGARLGLALTRIERVSGTPSVYRFHVDGDVCSIPATSFVDQRKVQGALFDLCAKMPRAVKKDEHPSWLTITNAIGAVAIPVDAGADATDDGELVSTLRDFLNGWPPRAIPSGTPIENPEQPFIRDGCIWWKLEAFMGYLRNAHVRDTRRSIAQRLGMLGAERWTAKVYGRGRDETTNSFHKIAVDSIDGLRAAEVNVNELIAGAFATDDGSIDDSGV